MCCLKVLFALNNSVRNLIVFCLIKHSEKESCCEQSLTRCCDSLLINKSRSVSVHKFLICTSAVKVTSKIKSKFNRLFGCSRNLVILMEVSDCPAIGNEMSLESPFISYDINHKRLICTARLIICSVICAHYCLNISFLYASFKSRKICLLKVFCGSFGIEIMSLSLGT